jgi:hypothetical protein
MDTPKLELPTFSDKDRTPLVDALMAALALQQKQNLI